MSSSWSGEKNSGKGEEKRSTKHWDENMSRMVTDKLIMFIRHD